MGCWSERCALTGLEISSGQMAYAALISERGSEFDGHTFIVPPLKGAYDDYGGIDLVETFASLGLVKGANWRPDGRGEANPLSSLGGMPVYFHAGIFEMLNELRPEFDYITATIGAEVNKTIAGIEAIVEEIEGNDSQGDDLPKADWRAYANLRRKFDFPEKWAGAGERLEDLIDNGEDRDEFFVLYRRILLLKSAEFELRHPIVPSRRGPQHGGSEALRQMNDWIGQVLEFEDDDRRADHGHHTRASGYLYELPFEVSQSDNGQVEITSADGNILWSRIAPDESDEHRRKTEIGRARAFADWMVAKLNA